MQKNERNSASAFKGTTEEPKAVKRDFEVRYNILCKDMHDTYKHDFDFAEAKTHDYFKDPNHNIEHQKSSITVDEKSLSTNYIIAYEINYLTNKMSNDFKKLKEFYKDYNIESL